MTTDSERRENLERALRTNETKRRVKVKASTQALMGICAAMAMDNLPINAGSGMTAAMATALFAEALRDEGLREALLFG